MSCEGKDASYFPTELMIQCKTPQEFATRFDPEFPPYKKAIASTFELLTKLLEGSLIDLVVHKHSKCESSLFLRDPSHAEFFPPLIIS